MRKTTSLLCLAGLVAWTSVLPAQDGPFDPAAWPPTANPDATVHFVSVGSAFTALGPGWTEAGMSILSGGDQVTQPITIGGFNGVKLTGTYLNTADAGYTEWADDDMIDILMQVYGDAAVLNPQGQPRNYNFLIGTLPELDAPLGGSLPVEAKNQKWNWVLFRIPNTIRPSDGTRRVGSIPANAQGAFQNGGVNSGTIRLENVPGIIVRVVAFGAVGAFGEPAQINRFVPPEVCDPEPDTNYAFYDVAANTSLHMQVLNNGDQTVTFEDNVGPDGDKRRAVRANGNYMNVAITDDYLGKPCNDPRSFKVCVEFYDDPAAQGVRFGPEAYATDALGGVGFYPANRRYTLPGSGQWRRVSFVVPNVNLFGVNVTPLTAGPRLIFDAPVWISRLDLAILRVAPHPLAGQDPLADCFEDPNICTDAYANYVEMDLANGILNGLAPGSSVGDQVMIQAEAGPENDRRLAIRPAHDDGPPGFRHDFLNFAITGERLGPSTQPNARLGICVTYHDDPTLVGQTFWPQVYQSDRGGITTFAFPSPSIAVRIEGTDRWREAYFELPDVKFNGVNQGPQAAARFTVTGKIFFSRVRYGVIRPCGPWAGQNPVADCGQAKLRVTPIEGGAVRISWSREAAGYVLEETLSLAPDAVWTAVAEMPEIELGEYVVTAFMENKRFYRLRQP
jgi:hypothetical protein